MDFGISFESQLGEATSAATGLAGATGDAAAAAAGLTSNWGILIGGLVLIIAAVLIIYFVKKIVVNSILGLVSWAVVVFLLQVPLSFLPSLVVSVLFGPAGIGVLLVLAFLGIVV